MLCKTCSKDSELRVNFADDSEWEAFLLRLGDVKTFANSPGVPK